jgi:transposase
MELPQRMQWMQMNTEELDALVARVESASIEQGDIEAIKAMAETVKLLRSAVQEKTISIQRLLRMLFGAPTETSKHVVGGQDDEDDKYDDGDDAQKPADSSRGLPPEEKQKPKGHGRNGAGDYTGANRVSVPHESLKRADACPECPKGKVYPVKTPSMVLCLTGAAPVQATVYELEKLRCNLCGKVFTAEPPDAACQKNKYDETVGSIIALLKYGGGFPFNRLEKLQGGFGIPLAASTQWDIVDQKADVIHPVYDELVRQAAQGKVVHNDDTTAKILQFMGANKAPREEDPSRTGIFTTGILSQLEEHQIALYFTSRKHAGENMADLLARRDLDRDPPIQMCDALSRNLPKPFKTILANCLSHARRKFVEVIDYFPAESRVVLDTLRQVYKHDAITKDHKMSDERRLEYHQVESAPLMEDLHAWLNEQFEEKTIEPNSSMGEAISYMLNHWPELTLFLQVPGAPLDNNLCEQILKRAILHRKNSMFFKTQHGAYVGDLYMSLIHTCILNGVNPFDYLTALEKNPADLREDPEKWLPWNYEPTPGG